MTIQYHYKYSSHKYYICVPAQGSDVLYACKDLHDRQKKKSEGNLYYMYTCNLVLIFLQQHLEGYSIKLIPS